MENIKNDIKTKEPVKHYNTFCYECKTSPIIGDKYSCFKCNKNFCQICYENVKFTHPHELGKICISKKQDVSFEVTDKEVISYLKKNKSPAEYINYVKKDKNELDVIREKIFMEKLKIYSHEFSGNEENIAIENLEINPEFINDFKKPFFLNLAGMKNLGPKNF